MVAPVPCILVVDDNPGNRYVLAHTLRRDGYRIVEADCGMAALAAVQQVPALVVLDVRLPDMSGIEVCQRIRDNALLAHVPILHVSAERMSPDDQALGLDQGADGYLVHPIAPEVLRSTVRALLRSRTSEHHLRQERDRLAMTLDNVGDGVVTTNMQWQIVSATKAAAAVLGRDWATLPGKRLTELLRVEETALETAVVGGADGERRRFVAKVRKRQTLLEVLMAPITQGDAPPLGRVLVFRDMTDQQRAEDAMIVAQKLESIGALAAGIAHDFNNMLTAVLGNVSLARLSSGPSEDLLLEAENACLRARTLANRLLTFAKGGEPVKKPAALGPLLRDAAEFAVRGSAVQCFYDIANDLPVVDVDAHQLSQVVHNLVVNGTEAMPRGGALKISAQGNRAPKGRRGRGFVSFTVEDKGSGIHRDLLCKIFDPYFSTKAKNSGLGLTVVYSIVQKHGGVVEVDTTPEQGTRFTVYLPVGVRPE